MGTTGRSLAALVVLLFLVCGVARVSTGADTEFVRLPTLPKSGAISLRVAILERDAFDSFTATEWQEMLAITRQAMAKHFQVDVVFETPVSLSLAEIFLELDRRLSPAHKALIADIDGEGIDRARLLPGIEYSLPRDSEELKAAFAFAQQNYEKIIPPLTAWTKAGRREQFADRLFDILTDRITMFRQRDGKGIFTSADRDALPGYNEWVYWDALPSLGLPFDVYLTNQPVVSVEYMAYPMHAILRGGVTVGTTSGARNGRFGSASWISIFSVLDRSEPVHLLRGKRDYSRSEAVRFAGLYLTHELGHMLFHFDHPWDNPACAMRPSELLRVDEWAAALDPARCRIGSSPAMTIGAVSIPKYYDFSRNAQ